MGEADPLRLAELLAIRYVPPRPGPVEDLLGVALALDDWAARESAAGEALRANRLRTCARMVRGALELLTDLAIRPPERLP